VRRDGQQQSPGRETDDPGRAWDEWYAGDLAGRTLAQQVAESPYDKMRRAFLAGWAERDAVMRRAAADELTALTEELGLYEDGGGS
jgi:hypothetical protein